MKIKKLSSENSGKTYEVPPYSPAPETPKAKKAKIVEPYTPHLSAEDAARFPTYNPLPIVNRKVWI